MLVNSYVKVLNVRELELYAHFSTFFTILNSISHIDRTAEKSEWIYILIFYEATLLQYRKLIANCLALFNDFSRKKTSSFSRVENVKFFLFASLWDEFFFETKKQFENKMCPQRVNDQEKPFQSIYYSTIHDQV